MLTDHQTVPLTEGQPILSTEETETTTTTTTTVTKTRRIYVTPSSSPIKASSMKSVPLSRLTIKPSSPTKAGHPPSSLSISNSAFPAPYSHVSRPDVPRSCEPQAHPAAVVLHPVTPPPPVAHCPLNQAEGPLLTVHPVPHPEELILPGRGQYIQGFYVVFCGRECGIYFNWYVN